ncbi:hypothetical protein ACFWDZ_08180 [Micromonospora aurantiaca]|uniref:Uncharacterized protein n=1 Tax=Micromonospora aurantiaca (nom. illeg.) TaxID=47850 RepID=A0A6N3JVL5_9ACTN|nr:hypothetical protein [Micromonospora aurantiaca]AXH89888.1 hypothetical protein DVH21_08060 [Micromonospora aurantiaca]
MISVMPPSHRAFTFLSALLLAGSTSCTSHDASPTSQASPSQPASTVSSLPTAEAPQVLSVPPVTSDEISRAVYTAKTQRMDATMRGEAHAGQQYALDAACTSATPGKVIKYELLSSKSNSTALVASGELPCDGHAIKNVTPLPATAIQISLGPDLADVTSAYAIITPST